MDTTQFAIQAVRHDERQKVGAKLLALAVGAQPNDPALREFISKYGLSAASGIADVIQAVAAEVASWPIPDSSSEEG
jgi:hypothetical protein